MAQMSVGQRNIDQEAVSYGDKIPVIGTSQDRFPCFVDSLSARLDEHQTLQGVGLSTEPGWFSYAESERSNACMQHGTPWRARLGRQIVRRGPRPAPVPALPWSPGTTNPSGRSGSTPSALASALANS
jgi:hypothetical protein